MGIFNMDSPLMRGLSRITDLIILNVIFLICCIPIFTIGASLTGMSYVLLRIHDGDEGYIVRGFFKSFRQNFRQATLIWLMILALGLLLFGDLFVLRSMSGTFSRIITIVVLIIGFFLAFVLLYVFAVLARFENTILNTLKNALLMSLLDFPRTVLMLLIVVAAVLVSFINGTVMIWAILVWILIGFALVGYCNSWFLKTILKKYMPKEEEEQTEEEVIEDMDRQLDSLGEESDPKN